MRIHTKLGEQAFYDAADEAGVILYRFERHGSRSHHHAFDVILSGSSSYTVNPGTGPRTTRAPQAATWDEWGIFLGQLFLFDEGMKAGEYPDAEQFHDMTANRFYYGGGAGLRWEDQHRRHQWTAVVDGGLQCGADDCTATLTYAHRVTS